MIVYQADPDTGVYLGSTEADESPLEPGVFLIPRGCRMEAPPVTTEGQLARWSGGAWAVEPVPLPEIPEGSRAVWAGISWVLEPVPLPEIPEGHRARWVGTEWLVEPIPEPEPQPPETLPTPTRLFKATVWQRVTDQEAELLDAAFQETPLRLRRLLDAAVYLDTQDPDFSFIQRAVSGALGSERAAQVLEPEF